MHRTSRAASVSLCGRARALCAAEDDCAYAVMLDAPMLEPRPSAAPSAAATAVAAGAAAAASAFPPNPALLARERICRVFKQAVCRWPDLLIRYNVAKALEEKVVMSAIEFLCASASAAVAAEPLALT